MKCLRCLCTALLVMALLFSFCSCLGTRTEDPAKYGDYTRAYNHKAFEEFTSKLLPEKLEEYFENVEYSCMLNQTGGECHEVFLQFNITDAGTYFSYKQSVLGENETKPFYYDESCEQFALFDDFCKDTGDTPDVIFLYEIEILKVLFCDETQTVTYFAIYSPNTSPVYRPSYFLYFEKFEIDVTEGYHSAFDE